LGAASFDRRVGRLLGRDVSPEFFDTVTRQARKQDLLSGDRFAVSFSATQK
jgi:hypothetical protein